MIWVACARCCSLWGYYWGKTWCILGKVMQMLLGVDDGSRTQLTQGGELKPRMLPFITFILLSMPYIEVQTWCIFVKTHALDRREMWNRCQCETDVGIMPLFNKSGLLTTSLFCHIVNLLFTKFCLGILLKSNSQEI